MTTPKSKSNKTIPFKKVRKGMLFEAISPSSEYRVLGYALGNWRKARSDPARTRSWEGRVISTLVLFYSGRKDVPFVTDFWIPPEHADTPVTIIKGGSR